MLYQGISFLVPLPQYRGLMEGTECSGCKVIRAHVSPAAGGPRIRFSEIPLAAPFCCESEVTGISHLSMQGDRLDKISRFPAPWTRSPFGVRKAILFEEKYGK
ncbi:hypothetical protein E4U43_003056 [Claviceps pusilla]|uniref:Uncharacterized protein n=1 Tax=Claviceps pusilla TaxID=123648 RepID=A0A9P7NHM4_9HYPO|nr:hypothetical protein E4U43_003056 [Claviceps pusilla]